MTTMASVEPKGQFRACRNCRSITLPVICTLEPPRKAGTMKLPSAGMNTIADATRDAGCGQRQDHPPEGLERRGAEILRRLHQRPVEPLDVRIDRQEHERDENVDEPEDNRELGEDHVQRFVHDAESGAVPC